VSWPVRGLVAVALLAGCGERAPSPSPAAPAATPSSAVVAPARATEVAPGAIAIGPAAEAIAEVVRDADGVAAIAAPADARIERVHVRPGDRVAAGAAVATVVLPTIAIEAARVAGADLRLGPLVARRDALVRSLADGLARAADLAEVEATLAEVRAERAVALAAVRAAGPGDRVGGGRVVLRAPIAGVVVEVSAAIGEHRGPADGPLARIAGGGATRVAARWVGAPPGGPARLLLDDGGERALTEVAVAPSLDPDGAIAVWYDVVGPPLTSTARGRVVIGATP
jgi:multidrug efflux pump subunit AcrA (membrane-fusion protein)